MCCSSVENPKFYGGQLHILFFCFYQHGFKIKKIIVLEVENMKVL